MNKILLVRPAKHLLDGFRSGAVQQAGQLRLGLFESWNNPLVAVRQKPGKRTRSAWGHRYRYRREITAVFGDFHAKGAFLFDLLLLVVPHRQEPDGFAVGKHFPSAVAFWSLGCRGRS